MSLGNSIYKNRKRMGLSQIELAEKLSVSRQSVSKWETDTAVPEIDKLVAMGEIFGITLDNLIKGEDDFENPELEGLNDGIYKESGDSGITESCQITKAENLSPFPGRKIVGTILLCFACLVFLILTVLGGVFSGFVFSLPFLLCGLICFIFKRNIGLSCLWAVYFAIDVYLSAGTGVNRGSILYTFSWTREMNYAILAISWISFLILFALWAVTVYRGGRSLKSPKKRVALLSVSLVSLAACRVVSLLLVKSLEMAHHEYGLSYNYGALRRYMALHRCALFTVDWITIVSFTVLSVCVVSLIACLLRKHRNRK